MGKPVVSINYELEGAYCVGTNNYREEFGLVYRILRERGCKKPAFVNGLKTSAEAQARAQGFRDACAHLGIKDVRFYQANWQMEAGVVTAKKILRQRFDLPDVIFCCNDDLAVGVSQTLQDAGIRVPEDVLITGFDNREIGQRATPRITTIDRDYRTIAGTALNTIFKLMNAESLDKDVFSPAKYILSESCRYPHEPDSERLNALYAVNNSLKRFYEVLGNFQFAVAGAESLFSLLEICELFSRELDCSNVFLSLNGNYYPCEDTTTSGTYGAVSHLVARRERTTASRCNGEHVYASFDTMKLLPPDVAFNQPIYTVCPLRYDQKCMGTLVTEGVPTIMRYGFLAFFLTMIATSIESEHMKELLHSENEHTPVTQ